MASLTCVNIDTRDTRFRLDGLITHKGVLVLVCVRARACIYVYVCVHLS